MGETQQVPDGREAEQEPLDYDNMSTEELEQRLRDGEGVVTVEAPEPYRDPEPEAKPEDDGQKVDEQQAEPEAGVEDAEQVAGSQAAEEPEEEFDEQKSMRDELILRLEKSEAERKKFEYLQSNRAAELDFLRKQVQALTAQQSQIASAPDDGYEAEPMRGQPTASSDPFLQARLAELESDSKTRGIESEYRAFIQDHPDADGLIQEMAPSIQEQLEPYKNMDLNPRATRKVLRLALDSAYADVKLKKIQEARAAALERRASQVPKKKQAKLAAAISGSGAAPAPKAQPKRIEDMTAEEADAALIREYGDGHYRRR